MIRAPLEKALVDELSRFGLAEPIRVYRPALEARAYSTGENELHQLIQRALGVEPTGVKAINSTLPLFSFEVVKDSKFLTYQFVLSSLTEPNSFRVDEVDKHVSCRDYIENVILEDKSRTTKMKYPSYEKIRASATVDDEGNFSPNQDIPGLWINPFENIVSFRNRKPTIETIAKEFVSAFLDKQN